jgi:hypothetical protein
MACNTASIELKTDTPMLARELKNLVNAEVNEVDMVDGKILFSLSTVKYPHLLPSGLTTSL